MPKKYYDFSVLDDLDATSMNSASEIVRGSDSDSKLLNSEQTDELPGLQIVIPLADTVKLNYARELCNRLSFILDNDDEVIEYTKPEFYSKYPHFNKLGIPRLESSRTANGITFFADFEKRSLRKLDRLFKKIVNLTEEPNEHIIITDAEGWSGNYSKLAPEDESVSMLAVGRVLGINYEELKAYEKWKEARLKTTDSL